VKSFELHRSIDYLGPGGGGGGGGTIIVSSSLKTGPTASSTQLAALTAMINTKAYLTNFIFQWIFVVEHDQHKTHERQSDPYQSITPVVESLILVMDVLVFFRPRVPAFVQMVIIPLPVKAVRQTIALKPSIDY
jgi:hypothetical protein